MSILITRPEPDASELVKILNKSGLKAWSLPLIKFNPGKELKSLPKKISFIRPSDMIFILSKRVIYYINNFNSPNRINWPCNVNYYAIGYSSAHAFQKISGQTVNYPKIKETSNNLITLTSCKNIENKRALILRGNGGYELLANNLRSRGTKVIFCECYQRTNNNYCGAIEGKRWKKYGVNTLVVTSAAMLKQLFLMFSNSDTKEWLLSCRILVVSKRLANLAYHLGWEKIKIAETARNESLLYKLL